MTPCTGCRGILGRLVKSHFADACPLRKASYCGLCANYGHSPANCPDTGSRAFRVPQFMEQLVPPSLLAEFNIQSQTPLLSSRVPEKPRENIMEVPETEEAIRAALMAAGERPMICQEKGRREKREMMENKKKLQKIADAAGKKLVYVSDSSAVVTAPTKQKKNLIKKAAES